MSDFSASLKHTRTLFIFLKYRYKRFIFKDDHYITCMYRYVIPWTQRWHASKCWPFRRSTCSYTWTCSWYLIVGIFVFRLYLISILLVDRGTIWNSLWYSMLALLIVCLVFFGSHSNSVHFMLSLLYRNA